MGILRAMLSGAVLSGSLIDGQAQTPVSSPPAVVPAVDGIFVAFQSHSIVGVADWHGLAQEEDFYVDLIRDPRFADEIGNVVVEFGDAAQQDTIDRYLAGEDIPYEQLRRVWTDTVGWLPTVTALGYLNFFAQVRAVNEGLPLSERIHIWLGEPPIDWSKVKTSADLTQTSQRDRYPAELIKSQILAKHRKSLVIYGSVHFFGSERLKPLVEQSYPGAFFVVTPYRGFQNKMDSDVFEQDMEGWRSRVPATQAKGAKALLLEEQGAGAVGDALLYLGPAASLTESPITPDLYLDLAFRKEINRRSLIVNEHLSRLLSRSCHLHSIVGKDCIPFKSFVNWVTSTVSLYFPSEPRRCRMPRRRALAIVDGSNRRWRK